MRKRYILPLASAFFALWACGSEEDSNVTQPQQDPVEQLSQFLLVASDIIIFISDITQLRPLSPIKIS